MTDHEGASALQDLILTRLQQLGDRQGPMSSREAARRSGGLVSYETLRVLARGGRHSGRITDRIAEGLALALQVPVGRVYEAAGLPTPSGRWDWPDRFSRLTPPERTLVEDLASALLGAYERGRREAK